jgi:3-deoxy-manno-octulosonate cytidylyltransferase (CMP-KDO synthetase)
MLLHETGRALVVHTAENTARCPRLVGVVVATDSPEIEAVVAAAGIDVVMTSTRHRSGTDRVREALDLWMGGDVGQIDVVVGVQGDEPDLAPEDLGRLVDVFEDERVEAATLCHPIEDSAEAASSHRVKVVRDHAGDALYFSRSMIPSGTYGTATDAPPLGHVGVYAWRPEALARFCELPPGKLEMTENLEQLRWLEAGGRMRVLDASRHPRGIDTEEDYAAFVQRTLSSDSHNPTPPLSPPDPVQKTTP